MIIKILKQKWALRKFKNFVLSEAKKHEHRKQPITWFTSDLHYGHNNVINYCDRPFKDAHEMNVWITTYWNAVVKPFDTIYVLGDFSINPKHHPKYLPRLNGKKILIVGNHDHVLQFAKGSEGKRKKIEDILRLHWDEIHSEKAIRLWDTKTDEILDVYAAHMPYANEIAKEIDDRYWHKRPKDEGKILLHGHQHARFIKNGRLIDVGFDGNLHFYTEQDIINLINDPRDYIPSRITEFYKQRSKNDSRVQDGSEEY